MDLPTSDVTKSPPATAEAGAIAGAPAPRARRSSGPRGAGGWLKLLGVGFVLNVVFAILASLVLEPRLAGLLGVTLATYLAGKWAGVTGVPWWIVSWVLVYVVTTFVSVVLLIFLGSQVGAILEATPAP